MSTHTTSPSSGQNLAKIVARRSSLSRRKASEAIKAGRVELNNNVAQIHDRFHDEDNLKLDGQRLEPATLMTVIFHKPVGYEVSRQPQGDNPSIYQLIPAQYKHLQHVGRLDTDSSGLQLLTNDGELQLQLTHPRYKKQKIYEVKLDAPLAPEHQAHIQRGGVSLDDGPSQLHLRGADVSWVATIAEGRNRQIRRTFAALGYTVIELHRIQFGPYKLGNLKPGEVKEVDA